MKVNSFFFKINFGNWFSYFSKLIVSFHLIHQIYSSSSSYFKTPYVVVGVVEDLNNIEMSFVPVDTVMLEATTWTKYEISFENYKGSGKNIGFVSPFSFT